MKTTLAYSMIAAMLIPAASMAQDRKESGVYIGGAYGMYKVEGEGKNEGDAKFDDDQDVFQAILGGQVNKYFAVEGSYINFGEYGGNLASAEVDGMTLAVKGILPISDVFSIYAKGGQLWWDADYQVGEGLLEANGSTDGSEPFYGIGVAFAVTDRMDINLDYTRYEIELETDEVGLLASDSYDSDLDQASVGVRYLF